MIYELLREKNLAQVLKPGAKLLPEYSDRAAWGGVGEDIKRQVKQDADKLKGKRHGILPATLYMAFRESGDRAVYENVYFERRTDLMTLIIAECIFAEGEYIGELIDLIWAICEESSWVPSPHNNKGELPDIEYEVYVDLFAAETGAIIAWAYRLLGGVIGGRAPTVKRRMELEVDRRILAPYLQYSHFGYMGLESERPVNNWNPWINSNVIVAFAVFEQGRERLAAGIEKTALTIDKFVQVYKEPGDGACDEGPGYFGVAGASLFDYLEVLSALTGGAVDELYENELIKDMARYAYRVYIGGDYFVNFADGSPRPGVPAKLFERLGALIGDDNLTGFAAHLLASEPRRAYAGRFCMYRSLKSLFQADKQAGFTPPESHWFSGTQILTARDAGGSLDGIFIAAKGGHNAESHNHNDVGHFILYADGKPVIVDAGVETYTRKTFSGQRYEIWTMRSSYHNLPDINGHEQAAGKQYCAADVRFTQKGGASTLAMELKGAYPESAGINSYGRELIFKHGESLTVRDSYELSECGAPFIFNLLCANKPGPAGGGLSLGEGIVMQYDGASLEASVEPIKLTDAKIRRDWRRDYLYRVRLTERGAPKKENKTEVIFRRV